MNFLIVGSGGREHAITWKLTQSKVVDKLFVAPGNPGTAQIAQNVAIGVEDFEKLAQFCTDNKIDIVIVGPEVPLVKGIKNFFNSQESTKHIAIVGPDQTGAQLEGSKDFSKNFMFKYGIPTASSQTFTGAQLQEGLAYLENHTLPIVLKADGLAAGKGVIIAESHSEAKETLIDMLAHAKFGDASSKVVIEQFLSGIEMSTFVLCDGENFVILPEAKDYKRIGEQDKGLNTGGMGAVSPVPFADDAFLEKVKNKVVLPTIEGLKKEGIDYTGFIFVGLMNCDGEPYVIEYNARMGDPETEVVFPRITSDVGEMFKAVADKKLDSYKLEITSDTATTVVLVSGGYPEDYEKGFVISGVENTENVQVFHAGTSLKDGALVNTGGRVFAVTGFGQNIEEALAKSNKAAQTIVWNKKYFRKDIGLDLLKYQKS
ncbi:MAG: phosphoribosylamine--glycine ligase [Cytophagales bacterium]